jgi:hypothetical protein
MVESNPVLSVVSHTLPPPPPPNTIFTSILDSKVVVEIDGKLHLKEGKDIAKQIKADGGNSNSDCNPAFDKEEALRIFSANLAR